VGRETPDNASASKGEEGSRFSGQDGTKDRVNRVMNRLLCPDRRGGRRKKNTPPGKRREEVQAGSQAEKQILSSIYFFSQSSFGSSSHKFSTTLHAGPFSFPVALISLSLSLSVCVCVYVRKCKLSAFFLHTKTVNDPLSKLRTSL